MPGSDSRERYTFAGFQLEPSRRLLIDAQGEPVKLTGKAFDALVYLVEHAGSLVDRATLIETVWPRAVVEDNNLNQAIAALRRAIGSGHVVTVAGRGYQFVTPVHVERVDDGASKPSDPVPGLDEQPRSMVVRVMAIGAALLATGAIGAFGFGHHSSTGGAALGEVDRIQPVTTYLGDEGTPALSPDGSRVAFSWDTRQGHSDIYVQQVSAGAPLELTRAAEGLDSNPVWSPDGERIAFLRNFDRSRFDVVVVPALGGSERTVASGLAYWISVDGYPMLAWTPDGKALLFTTQVQTSEDGQGYAFHLLDLDSGAVRLWPVVRDARDYDPRPRSRATDGAWRSRVTTSVSACRRSCCRRSAAATRRRARRRRCRASDRRWFTLSPGPRTASVCISSMRARSRNGTSAAASGWSIPCRRAWRERGAGRCPSARTTGSRAPSP